jgi:hypothetical protein
LGRGRRGPARPRALADLGYTYLDWTFGVADMEPEELDPRHMTHADIGCLKAWALAEAG